MTKKIYMCFSTDMVHSGHIDIIRKAEKLGDLTKKRIEALKKAKEDAKTR